MNSGWRSRTRSDRCPAARLRGRSGHVPPWWCEPRAAHCVCASSVPCQPSKMDGRCTAISRAGATCRQPGVGARRGSTGGAGCGGRAPRLDLAFGTGRPGSDGFQKGNGVAVTHGPRRLDPRATDLAEAAMLCAVVDDPLYGRALLGWASRCDALHSVEGFRASPALVPINRAASLGSDMRLRWVAQRRIASREVV